MTFLEFGGGAGNLTELSHERIVWKLIHVPTAGPTPIAGGGDRVCPEVDPHATDGLQTSSMTLRRPAARVVGLCKLPKQLS